MTAPISPAQFIRAGDHDIHQISAMWRGALIDQFAALEAITLDCLIALHDAGHLPGKFNGHYAAWQRFPILADALRPEHFAPYNTKAIKLLTALETHRALRTALAHGQLRCSLHGVRLAWRTLDKQAWAPHALRLTWLEALAAMTRVERLRRDLSSQLGQISQHRLPRNSSTRPQWALKKP